MASLARFWLALLVAAGATACALRLPDPEGGCAEPTEAEVAVLQRFTSTLATELRVAELTIAVPGWLGEPGAVTAWVGDAGMRDWAARAGCAQSLRRIVSDERLFTPGQDRIVDSQGWAFLGRVALGADGGVAALPVWALQQHPAGGIPPFATARLFRYTLVGSSWVFEGTTALPEPDRPAELFRARADP